MTIGLRLRTVSRKILDSTVKSLNVCTPALVCVVMILGVVAFVPVYPAKGIPIVPVRVTDDCGDGREVVLTVGAQGELKLDRDTIQRDDLESRLEERLATRSVKVVFIDADGSLPFHSVAEVLGRVQSRGRVALLPKASGARAVPCVAFPGVTPWTPGSVALPKPQLSYVVPWAR